MDNDSALFPFHLVHPLQFPKKKLWYCNERKHRNSRRTRFITPRAKNHSLRLYTYTHSNTCKACHVILLLQYANMNCSNGKCNYNTHAKKVPYQRLTTILCCVSHVIFDIKMLSCIYRRSKLLFTMFLLEGFQVAFELQLQPKIMGYSRR